MIIQKHRKGEPTQVLAEMYQSGKTTVEIGRLFGMSPAAVNGRLRRYGVPIRSAQRRSPADKLAVKNKVVIDYLRGVPMVDLAKRENIARSTVRRILGERGIKTCKAQVQTVTVPTDAGQIGYLAGLFDGEGNLQMRTKNGNQIACKMAIYNTAPSMMQWLVKTVGGHLRYDSKRTATKGWLPIGIWEVYRARDVAALLRAMLPHLTAKRERTLAALRHLESKFQVHDSPPQIIQLS